MADYEKYKKECKKIKKEKEKLLEDFLNWLAEKGLSSKTIKKHVGNMDFYINEYLLYYEPKTAAEGAYHIDDFLGCWFIKKAMWASKTSINDYTAGFKKFYKFMLEKGLIAKEDYEDVCLTIKEKKADWLETLERFDDPDITDPGEIWDFF